MTRDSGWFTSSFSSSGSPNCVEVRITDGSAHIRDTKSRDSGTLRMDVPAWVAFVHMSIEPDRP
jgi:hypothetical protein